MRIYYSVIDCEHEGDVSYAESELIAMGARILREDYYEYEDDEDPDADHEICGCTIILDIKEEDKQKFIDYGCYC